ncbi:hypothetical protein ABI59_16565 [Acidobacteria bacterium Mor1]|nr:hypothetical protein ABI59_16565 [Acidobacteria bacterium Mor1]
MLRLPLYFAGLMIASAASASSLETDILLTEPGGIRQKSPGGAPREFTLPDGVEPLSGELLDRLQLRAGELGERYLRFSCIERVEAMRLSGRREGRPRKEQEAFFLMERRGESLDEIRLSTDDRRRSMKRKWGLFENVPGALDWALLFAESNRRTMSFYDLGREADPLGELTLVGFRGTTPFADGSQVTEWEGIAALRASDLALRRIRARPREESERMREQLDRRRRSTKISFGSFEPGFRFKPIAGFRTRAAPELTGFEAEFDTIEPGVTFPLRMRYTRERVEDDGSLKPLERTTVQYVEFRRFEVDSEDDRKP